MSYMTEPLRIYKNNTNTPLHSKCSAFRKHFVMLVTHIMFVAPTGTQNDKLCIIRCALVTIFYLISLQWKEVVATEENNGMPLWQ